MAIIFCLVDLFNPAKFKTSSAHAQYVIPRLLAKICALLFETVAIETEIPNPIAAV